ncbi:head-tail adaptor protein [Paenibacillus larvae]|nr:hypothetical protein [Paenibacillus larvae]MDT2277414.1 head-tail adaptor protein [Paenibacillus larvae]
MQHGFIIRYRKGLHPDMRIKYNNRYLILKPSLMTTK